MLTAQSYDIGNQVADMLVRVFSDLLSLFAPKPASPAVCAELARAWRCLVPALCAHHHARVPLLRTQEAMDLISRTDARIIVVFGGSSMMPRVFQAAAAFNLTQTPYTWIASDGSLRE